MFSKISLALVGLILLSVSSFALADQEEELASKCGAGDYNLATLVKTGSYWNYDNTATNGSKWYFNFCTPVVGSFGNACDVASTAVCQVTKSGSEYPAGALSSTKYVPLPKSIGTEGLGVQYGGGKDCGSTPRQTTIYIKCGESQFKAISASEPKGSCVYTITIESTAGCAASGSGSGSGSGVIPTGGGSTGGSTGSSSGSFLGWFWGWLVIILFVLVVVVYLVAGGVYKFKVLEERGLEVVPNIDFWRDVPSLVKDGSVFGFHAITCHKLDSNY
eukprot:TRINITY_DN998_c0_g1_i2.p1 TRINITY_DN998_c0_g1~~TRINITY_DN998_c0_g1_i2.p1  ORF type:complete len:275 (-),score=55.48 TRINITY_DN998_c0_g1_i2:232-1056(-)